MPAVIVSQLGVQIVKEGERVVASLAGNVVRISGDRLLNAFIGAKDASDVSTFVGGSGAPQSVILDSGAVVYGLLESEVELIDTTLPPQEILRVLEGLK